MSPPPTITRATTPQDDSRGHTWWTAYPSPFHPWSSSDDKYVGFRVGLGNRPKDATTPTEVMRAQRLEQLRRSLREQRRRTHWSGGWVSSHRPFVMWSTGPICLTAPINGRSSPTLNPQRADPPSAPRPLRRGPRRADPCPLPRTDARWTGTSAAARQGRLRSRPSWRV